MPTMKLISKERINGKIIKKFDQPKTPYERIMCSTSVSQELKEKLVLRKKELNPFELRKGLEIKLSEFKEVLKKNQNLLRSAA